MSILKQLILRIPKKLGEDIQSLTVIGTPIAWLFAKTQTKDSKNGFTSTGGKFNYTAEVRFPETGDIARIFMKFTGLDVFDNLKAMVRLEGTVPKLSRGRRRRKKVLKHSFIKYLSNQFCFD